MVSNDIKTVFPTQVTDSYWNFIDVCEEAIEARGCREFTTFDQLQSLLDWLGVWEDHYGLSGFSQEVVIRFYRCRKA